MTVRDPYAVFDVLCPMHLRLDPDFCIVHIGPTLRKVLSGVDVDGIPFLDVFDVKRPQHVGSTEDLRQVAQQKLRVRFRQPPHLEVKGTLIQAPSGDDWIIDLSFGINVVRAVDQYALTAADFAVTDLTVEMLYLVEAKSAAMEASRHLNEKLQRARDTAEKQALTDALTGLSNRRAMDSMLEQLVHIRAPFALMHIDLDYFKAINDTFGHAAGDFVLKQVADVLRSEIRAGDLVSRLGGDEFALVFPQGTDRAIIDRIATRIIDRLSCPMDFCGNTCRIAASAGSTISTDYAMPDIDTMLEDADLALYQAKRDGRGRHRFFCDRMRQEAVS